MNTTPADTSTLAFRLRECAAVLMNAAAMVRHAGGDEKVRDKGLNLIDDQARAITRLTESLSEPTAGADPKPS